MCMYWISSRGQQILDGPPALGLKKNLITLQCKQLFVMKYYIGPWISSGQEQLAGFCQHFNRNSGSIKGRESFQWVNTCLSGWIVLHGVSKFYGIMQNICVVIYFTVCGCQNWLLWRNMDRNDLFKDTTLHLPEGNEEEHVKAAMTSIFVQDWNWVPPTCDVSA